MSRSYGGFGFLISLVYCASVAGCGSSASKTSVSCATPNVPLTGLIAQDTELTATSCNEWHVTAPGVDFEGATLTVDPGVIVVFDQGTYLEIGLTQPATLLANGTASSSVTFTSSAAVPAAGDWAGVAFGPLAGSASLLSYLTVSDAGSTSSPSTNGITYPGAIVAYGDSADAVSVELTNVDVDASASSGIVFAGPYAGMATDQGFTVGSSTGSRNISVSNWAANGYPIVVDANQASTVPPSITIGSSTNVGGYGNNVVALACQAVVDCGDPMVVNSAQEWKDLPVSYQVVTVSGVDVENGLLTIDPGATIEFADGAAFSVNNLGEGGALNANGTSSQPITFKSRDPDSAEGATWQGIKLVFDAAVTGWVMNYCQVSGALGYEVAQEGNEYAGAIVIGDVGDSGITAMPTITNCTIDCPPSNSTLPLPASPACGIVTLGLDFNAVSTMYGTAAEGQNGNIFAPGSNDVCSI
jgi:hypothetical protein